MSQGACGSRTVESAGFLVGPRCLLDLQGPHSSAPMCSVALHNVYQRSCIPAVNTAFVRDIHRLSFPSTITASGCHQHKGHSWDSGLAGVPRRNHNNCSGALYQEDPRRASQGVLPSLALDLPRDALAKTRFLLPSPCALGLTHHRITH